MGDSTSRVGGVKSGRPIVMRLGHEELVIHQRYETISIINDLLIGAWFLVGSFFFLSPSLTQVGTWLFVVGSIEMLIRPVIRFTRQVHLRRFQSDDAGLDSGSQDF